MNLAKCRSDLEAARRLHLDLAAYKAEREAHVVAGDVTSTFGAGSHELETGNEGGGGYLFGADNAIIPGVVDTQSLPPMSWIDCSQVGPGEGGGVEKIENMHEVSERIKSHLQDFRARSQRFQAHILQPTK